MNSRAIVALAFACVSVAGAASGQIPPPNPAQQIARPPETIAQDQTPVFRVTVVGAYHTRGELSTAYGWNANRLPWHSALPRAVGRANIEGKKGYIDIDARFDKLEPPSRFGPEYLTYVLWAITPEGRATNLGEVQYDDQDARIHVTTELQAFGLIVTAEPYFAVTQPSDAVVIENAINKETVGNTEVIQAKYELLKRGTYLMNQDARQFKIKPLEPGAPLDLAEARNAVALARIAGADRYASDSFAKASRLLTEAEQLRERKKKGNEVMMPARQAAQTAEDARLVAIQKQEEALVAEQRAQAQQREAAALERARAEEAARRQADSERQAQELLRRQAEIERLSADNARAAAERDRAAADAARLTAERDRAAAESDRLALERQKADADRQRADADAARLAAESARQAAEAQARDSVAQAEREKTALRDQLRQQLNVVLETRETARGLIVNLSDVLFDTASANLKPGAREKLAKVAGILLSHPDLHIEVDGHTDSVGSTDYNQRLSENRAGSVRDYLVRQGIGQNAVATAGFGETKPVTSNGSSAGRQQNRRVEIVVSGASIGRQ